MHWRARLPSGRHFQGVQRWISDLCADTNSLLVNSVSLQWLNLLCQQSFCAGDMMGVNEFTRRAQWLTSKSPSAYPKFYSTIASTVWIPTCIIMGPLHQPVIFLPSSDIETQVALQSRWHLFVPHIRGICQNVQAWSKKKRKTPGHAKNSLARNNWSRKLTEVHTLKIVPL